MSEISVLKIENPSCFWGIIKKGFGAVPDNAEAYERLYDELNQLYSTTYKDVDEIKPTALEEGQVCVVYSQELKCWCRAIVESFMSSADDFLAECFLVDHAKYIPVKTKSIRVAVEACWRLPYRAKQFKLHRIQPVTLHIDLREDKANFGPANRWDSAAIQYFQNLLKESNHTEVMLCSVEDNRYDVYLYVTTKDATVCVNDDLVAKNFACFANLIAPEESDASLQNCKHAETKPLSSNESYTNLQNHSPTETKQLPLSFGTSQGTDKEHNAVHNPAIKMWPVLLQVKSLEKHDLGYVLKDHPGKQPNGALSAATMLTEQADDDKHSTDKMLTRKDDKKHDSVKLLQMLNPDSLKADDPSLDQLQKPHLRSKPIVLRKKMEPCSTLELSPLSAELKKELIRNQFLGPNFTESFCWPSIAHGCDTVVISSHGRNPMIYIPPVLTYLQFSSTACTSLPTKNGPLALFLCYGWKKAQCVFELVERYGRCVKPLNPMLILIGLNKEEAKNIKLRRGCEVIITTPDSLLRLLEHHSLLFQRLCHLVFDEVDILFSEANDQMFRILEIYKKAVNAEEREIAPQQFIAAGSRWIHKLNDVVREYMTDPHVVITSMEEAALYGNVQQVVQLCLDCDKISAFLRVMDFTPTIADKILIFTNSVDEAEMAFKAVESSSIFCLKIHEKCSFHLNQVVKHWSKPCSLGTHVVLVLTDDYLPSLHITDASCVIHFGFPTSQRIFGMRMFSMLDNFRNKIDKDMSVEPGCSKAKSVLLMTEKNAHHAVGILRYLEHTEAKIPPELFDFTAGILSAKEDMKLGRSLCQQLKTYGICKETSICPCRHQFNPELDFPRRIADTTLPARGNISIIPLFIVNASCYYGRIVSNDDPYASLLKEMCEFYNESNNRVSVEKVEKLALCGLQEGVVYHRVKVLEVSRKEDDCLFCLVKVNYIDEGRQGEVQSQNLLLLPTRFQMLPPQAIEFIVCRVKPIDKETEWNPKVTRHISQKIKGKLHEAKIVLSIGNTVFVDPMVRVIKLVDLKTSINEYSVRSEILSTGMGTDNPGHLETLKTLCREEQMAANNEDTVQSVEHFSKSSMFQKNTANLQECISGSENDNESQSLEMEKDGSKKRKTGREEKNVESEDEKGEGADVSPAACVGATGATVREEHTGDSTGRPAMRDKLFNHVVDIGLETEMAVELPILTAPTEHKSFHPEVKWFQKEESLTLAIKIRNVTTHTCTFFNDRVVFSAFAGDKYYLADLELNDDILTDKSFCMIKNEEPILILAKANIRPWGSLLKQKNPNVFFDFEHWEDPEDCGRFRVVASCAKSMYTAVNEEVDSSENSESESD